MAARPHRRALTLLGMLSLLPGLGGGDAAETAVRRGNVLYQAGQYEAAAGFYQRAAEVLPNAAEIAFNQGDAAFKQFLYDQAADYYTAALDSRNVGLASSARYNLGTVRHRQAMQAMQSFQDALSLVRVAIDFYRDSLALDPEQADARYNLELAYQLLHAIEAQRVQGQRHAETRNQKTSDNHGQPFQEHADNQQAKPREAKPDEQQQAQGRQAQQAPPSNAISHDANQIQRATTPQDLTPEQAEAFLDAYRERAQLAQSLRQDARRSRLRDAGLQRYW